MSKVTINLPGILKHKSLTVEQAAELSGVTRPTIYKLIGGSARGIQFDTLAKLCDGLEIGLDELLQLESTPPTLTSRSRSKKNAAERHPLAV